MSSFFSNFLLTFKERVYDKDLLNLNKKKTNYSQ